MRPIDDVEQRELPRIEEQLGRVLDETERGGIKSIYELSAHEVEEFKMISCKSLMRAAFYLKIKLRWFYIYGAKELANQLQSFDEAAASRWPGPPFLVEYIGDQKFSEVHLASPFMAYLKMSEVLDGHGPGF